MFWSLFKFFKAIGYYSGFKKYVNATVCVHQKLDIAKVFHRPLLKKIDALTINAIMFLKDKKSGARDSECPQQKHGNTEFGGRGLITWWATNLRRTAFATSKKFNKNLSRNRATIYSIIQRAVQCWWLLFYWSLTWRRVHSHARISAQIRKPRALTFDNVLRCLLPILYSPQKSIWH